METYDAAKNSDRINRNNNRKAISITDHRDFFVFQRKLISNIQSGNVVQRVGDPSIKDWWGTLTADMKEDIARRLNLDYKIHYNVSRLERYMLNDEDGLDVYLRELMKPEYSEGSKMTGQKLAFGTSELTVPAPVFKYSEKPEKCGLAIIITQPSIINLPDNTMIEIAFLQIVQSSALRDEPLDRANNYQDRYGPPAWTIDRSADFKYKSPFYGKDTKVGEEGDTNDSEKYTPGDLTTPAVLKDLPSNAPLVPGGSWTPTFKTSVVIRKCSIPELVGVVLTTIEWSFTLSKDESGVASITNVINNEKHGIPVELQHAAEIWNHMHPERENIPSLSDIPVKT